MPRECLVTIEVLVESYRLREFRRAAEQAVASIQGVRLGATVQASVIGLG